MKYLNNNMTENPGIILMRHQESKSDVEDTTAGGPPTVAQLRNRFEHLKRVAKGESNPHMISHPSINVFAHIFPKFENYFTMVQLENLEKCFRMADMDKDGYLNDIELKYWMEKHANPISNRQLRYIFKETDLDQDGVISFQEFLNLCKKIGVKDMWKENLSASGLALASFGQDKYSNDNDPTGFKRIGFHLNSLSQLKPDIRGTVEFFERKIAEHKEFPVKESENEIYRCRLAEIYGSEMSCSTFDMEDVSHLSNNVQTRLSSIQGKFIKAGNSQAAKIQQKTVTRPSFRLARGMNGNIEPVNDSSKETHIVFTSNQISELGNSTNTSRLALDHNHSDSQIISKHGLFPKRKNWKNHKDPEFLSTIKPNNPIQFHSAQSPQQITTHIQQDIKKPISIHPRYQEPYCSTAGRQLNAEQFNSVQPQEKASVKRTATKMNQISSYEPIKNKNFGAFGLRTENFSENTKKESNPFIAHRQKLRSVQIQHGDIRRNLDNSGSRTDVSPTVLPLFLRPSSYNRPQQDEVLKSSLSSQLIHSVHNKEEFTTELETAASNLVIVVFYANWCGPCKQMKPKMEEMARKFSVSNNVIFLKVNVDECEQVALEYGVSAMPTFMLFKNLVKIATFCGADPGSVLKLIESNK